MNVALYARVSSERQDIDLSISAQLKALREYAVKNSHFIVKEYVDEAESGRTSQRPAFREMIAAARRPNRPFDLILVWKYSSLARLDRDFYLRGIKFQFSKGVFKKYCVCFRQVAKILDMDFTLFTRAESLWDHPAPEVGICPQGEGQVKLHFFLWFGLAGDLNLYNMASRPAIRGTGWFKG